MRPFLLVIVLVVSIVFSLRTVASEFAVRTIALSGVSGSLGSSTNVGDVFLGFREPLMTSTGNVAFPAYLLLQDQSEQEGIWLNLGLGNVPIAQTGEPGRLGPNLGDGIVFDRLTNSYPGESGQVAFVSSIRGIGVTDENNRVTVIYKEGLNRVIARSGVQGELGPGIDGAVYQYLGGLQVMPNGDLVLSSTLIGPSIDDANHTGIWKYTDDERQLLMRTGVSGSVGPTLGDESLFVDDIVFFPPQTASNTGEVVFTAYAKKSDASPLQFGLWRNGSNINMPFMLSDEKGELGPGLGEEILFSVESVSSAPGFKFDTDSNGNVLFSADLSDGRSGFWTNHGEKNTLIALSGETGALGPGLDEETTFTDLSTNFFAVPTLNDNGSALFKGRLSDSRLGLFVNDGSGNRPIAITGVDDEFGPNDSEGNVFGGFNRAAINNDGTVFFTANASPFVPRNRLNGLWAYSDGKIANIAKVGVPFDVDPTEGVDEKIPYYVQMAYEQQVDSDGAVLNDQGELVFYMGFEDGTLGVFVAQIVPEPSTGILMSSFIAIYFGSRKHRFGVFFSF